MRIRETRHSGSVKAGDAIYIYIYIVFVCMCVRVCVCSSKGWMSRPTRILNIKGERGGERKNDGPTVHGRKFFESVASARHASFASYVVRERHIRRCDVSFDERSSSVVARRGLPSVAQSKTITNTESILEFR